MTKPQAMPSDAKPKLIPKLRFPEFRNAPTWELQELGPKTTKVGSGITPLGGDKNYKSKGRPFMRSQNVGWGTLLLDDIAFIDEETHSSFKATEIEPSDVLLNITGASIGRSAVADTRISGGNVNQHVCIKAHKKGLMQRVFPREGETVPQLRFPDFQNAPEWEEKTLGELFYFQDGFSFKSTDFTTSGEDSTQVIRITDINNKNRNDDKVYVPKSFVNSNNLQKYYVERGDLLLSLTGAAGFNFFIWDGETSLINQRTTTITPKRKTDDALLRLLEPLVYEKINSYGEGQNNNLSRDFLNSVSLRTPQSPEQQTIADFLTSLEELITAQADKLEALKTQKKGLMQQLFPPAEGGV